ncbi:TATA box-binding protein-associated factor RNA polymerase I subunit C-like [Temnothorax americanus]|uniref:TATA box-binding protein-associated factor RNA polymerase I subunit C-like n=1 Tax=Temnothorax americanus TaxID=1964332 RepID=UPI004067FDA5
MKAQELKSKAFKRAENNLLNKLGTAFLKNYPHHVMPGYNLNRSPCIEKWDEDNAIGLCQEFPYNCDLPKPLLPPAKLSRTVLSEEDPALQLLTLKSHLKDDINRIIKYYEKHKKEFDVVHKKSIKWKRGSKGYSANVPRYIADIAELLDMDPDPYFEGTYNWYYTGGSLNYVQLNDWDVLLFPFVGDLVAAHITPMEDFVWKPLLQNSAKCKLPGALYEIRQTKISDTCRILARHKGQCALYTLSTSENHLVLDEIHRQASKVPYVSADLSLTNNNYHCTLNAERILSLWDINSSKYISSGSVQQDNITHEHDAWGCIRFQETDPNVLIYVDRCCLHYLDTRTALDRACITLCPKFNLENCESLSIEAPSKHTCCRYLGTYHSFLLCDNRSPKQCVRQKWTHQFKDTPLLAAVTNSDDKEIIVLSTQKAGENTIILNTWMNEEKSHSFNLPFTPPHVAETLNKSQMQGMCLNPYLQSRFELCNAGSTLITNIKNAEVFYFIQNSIGDIFYQCITHENTLDKYSPINSKACYALNMWEKALSAQVEPIVPLTLTDKCNMQYIFENFTNKRLSPRLKSTEENADSFDPTWKQSLAKLGSYIDLLAPELLAAWEIREEVPVPVGMGSHQKVLNWLESSTSKHPVMQSQDEPEYIPTPVNTQELISVSQEQDLMYIDDSNMLQEMLLPKVKSGTTRKKKRT